MLRLLSILLLSCVALFAFAKEAVPLAEDLALEARVQQIAAELRCLVCQNETIAESKAGLAVDLRQQVREKLQQGLSEREIRDYMVARYGDFVLYRPPVKSTTLLLWVGPFVLLALAVFALAYYVRLRKRVAPSVALGESDTLRAQRLLSGELEPGSMVSNLPADMSHKGHARSRSTSKSALPGAPGSSNR